MVVTTRTGDWELYFEAWEKVRLMSFKARATRPMSK